ncbi:MAG: hypothetical protein JST04_09075 [Bdellovibrionales bacterium]|nr:hypothetical protein [Bdellovibrionales bacterium]
MKNPNRIFVLALCFSALSPAFAKEGGNGSHGGNTELSTENEALDSIRFSGYFFGNVLATWAAKPSLVPDARAREIVLRIARDTHYRSSYGLDDQDHPYYLVRRGSCRAAARKTTASAKVGKASEKFCLSVEEVRRIPPLSLNEQVPPLMGHELAHQAGYGEADAQYFQNFLLGIYKRAPEFYSFQKHLISAIVEAGDLEEGFRNGASSAALCRSIGAVNMAQKLLSDFDRTMTPLLPNNAGDRAAAIPGTHKLLDFCDQGGPENARKAAATAATGVRAGLESILNELLTKTAYTTLINH